MRSVSLYFNGFLYFLLFDLKKKLIGSVAFPTDFFFSFFEKLLC